MACASFSPASSAASAVYATTFTVGFGDPGYEDARYARLAARRFGTDQEQMGLGEDQLLALVPAALAAQYCPSGDRINTFIVSSEVRGVGLVLAPSGLGGMDFFGGYPTFGRLRRLFRVPVLQALSYTVRRSLAAVDRRVGTGVAAMKLADVIESDWSLESSYTVARQLFSPDQVRALLRNAACVTDCGQSLRGIPGAGLACHVSLGLLGREGIAVLRSYTEDYLLRDTDR